MELIEKIKQALCDNSPFDDDKPDDYEGEAQAALTALIEHAGQDGVQQSDRDAAQAIYNGESIFAQAGVKARDGHELVQAFARHRATAFAAGKAAREREIEEQQGVIKRLITANRVLRQGLHGLMDSEDASEIATLLTTGQSVDWDAYPEATRRAIERGEV